MGRITIRPTPGEICDYVPDVTLLGDFYCPNGCGFSDLPGDCPDCEDACSAGFGEGHECGEHCTLEPVALIRKDWNNRESESPVKVKYRVPTERDKRAIARAASKIKMALTYSEDGNPIGADLATQTSEDEELVRAFVTKVENYKPGSIDIANGEDLAIHGEDGFIEDIALEIRGAFEYREEHAKKFTRLPR